MSAEHTVVNNFLPEEQFQAIKKVILGSSIPWYYSPYVASHRFKDDGFYFLHTFYDYFKPNSPYFDFVLPLVNRIDVKAIVRMKANMYTNVGHQLKNNYHVDEHFPHKGMVYYVNTNNGYTELEDGTIIESVENRALLFDSSKEHRSVACTDEKCRVTINLNYF